jgi:flagellar biosynthesis/type III secretory pathway protein FliH
MEDLEGADEGGYNNEEVETIVNEAIEHFLAPIEKYVEKQIPQMINDICERILAKLNVPSLKKQCKYVVTCAIV